MAEVYPRLEWRRSCSRQAKIYYAEWIQREVGGGGDSSETESETESETDEEDGEFVTQEKIDNKEGWARRLEELYAPGGMKAEKAAREWQAGGEVFSQVRRPRVAQIT